MTVTAWSTSSASPTTSTGVADLGLRRRYGTCVVVDEDHTRHGSLTVFAPSHVATRSRLRSTRCRTGRRRPPCRVRILPDDRLADPIRSSGTASRSKPGPRSRTNTVDARRRLDLGVDTCDAVAAPGHRTWPRSPSPRARPASAPTAFVERGSRRRRPPRPARRASPPPRRRPCARRRRGSSVVPCRSSGRTARCAGRAPGRGPAGHLARVVARSLDQRQRVQHRVVHVGGDLGALLPAADALGGRSAERSWVMRSSYGPARSVIPTGREGGQDGPSHGGRPCCTGAVSRPVRITPAAIEQDYRPPAEQREVRRRRPSSHQWARRLRPPAARSAPDRRRRTPAARTASRRSRARRPAGGGTGRRRWPPGPSPGRGFFPLPRLGLGHRRWRLVGAHPLRVCAASPARLARSPAPAASGTTTPHRSVRRTHRTPWSRDRVPAGRRCRTHPGDPRPAGHTGDDPSLGTAVRPERTGGPRTAAAAAQVARPDRLSPARIGRRKPDRRHFVPSERLLRPGGQHSCVRALVLPWSLRTPPLVLPRARVRRALPRRRRGRASVRGGPARRRGCWLAHRNDRHTPRGPTPAGLSPAVSSAPQSGAVRVPSGEAAAERGPRGTRRAPGLRGAQGASPM